MKMFQNATFNDYSIKDGMLVRGHECLYHIVHTLPLQCSPVSEEWQRRRSASLDCIPRSHDQPATFIKLYASTNADVVSANVQNHSSKIGQTSNTWKNRLSILVSLNASTLTATRLLDGKYTDVIHH